MIKRRYLHTKRRKGRSKKKIDKSKISKRPREAFTPSSGISISTLKNEVLKMQFDLAVVVRRREIDSVIHLTRLILRSKLAQELAVYRTISSTGSRTKGMKDKFKIRTRKQYDFIRSKLWNIIKDPTSYKASPLKRIWLLKPNSEQYRPISVPGYIDRALQHLHLLVLDVFSEEFADVNSYGFRSFRSPGWAAKALTLQVWSRKGFNPPKFAIELDIRKCFDSISHEFLVNLVTKYNFHGTPIELINSHIINQWLTSGYVEFKGTITPKDQTIPSTSGIPQGGPISSTLANMVLDGIENCLIVPTSTEKIHNITPNDKIIWCYEGKEILCTTGIEIENSTKINAALRSMGYNPPKSMARQFYLGNWIHRRGPWSYKAVNDESALTLNRSQINDQYAALVRYADDINILLNSLEHGKLIIKNIEEFLKLRGLGINDKKTHTRLLYENEKIKFVGFEFCLKKTKQRWKIYNYPPAEKILNVKAKVDKIFKTYKLNPYTAFYKANTVLRGWLNFYRVGNSKNAFKILHEWLFKRTYRYLTTYLENNPKYKIKGHRYKKKLLGLDLWNEFRFPSVYSRKTKWFGIPQNLNPNVRWSKKNAPEYMLIEPKFIEVSIPSIITGKSAYHPEDRLMLLEKAVHWKAGLHRKLLIKQKGLCKYCNCSLLDQYEEMDIHHITPIKQGGRKNLTNLAVLCAECHKQVFSAVKSKNIDQIILYEQAKILKNVSDIIFQEIEAIHENIPESDEYTEVENKTT